MDDNFSPKVRDVITYSKEEALRLGHDFIGTEHLLLGLIRKAEGRAIDILKTFENIVGDFLSKKAASEQQLKPLASLRDTLLPKLISGELSIPTAKDCA